MAASSSPAAWTRPLNLFGAGPGAIAVSALVASAGLFWFRMILKDVRTQPAATRFGIYVLIWLAYFVLMMMLAVRTAGA